MAVVAAAGAIVRRERQIVAAFRRAGATSTGTAVTPASISVHEHLAFRRLCHRAILREASPGLYYLDEPGWEALCQLRQRLALVLAVIGLAVIAVVFVLTMNPPPPAGSF